MKKILPIVGCVLLVIGIWLIFYANADVVTPNDVPVTPTEQVEPVKPNPGSEQGSTPPAPPIPADDPPNPLKAPVADKPCTEDTCPCNKKEQPVSAAKKQYTPVPWTPVPNLPEPTPPEMSSTTDEQPSTYQTIKVRRRLRR